MSVGCVIKRVIQFDIPISYGEVRLFDANHNEITNNCLYSWSTDSVCWTLWASKPVFDKAAPMIDGDFFLRILITTSLGEVWYNSLITTCWHISIYNEGEFLGDFCGNPNLFQPYANLDCALEMQQQLADSIICMLGIPCYYFKVTSNPDTIDYTFKEYILQHVESVKVLKLMVQDGEMPSSKPEMSDFDFAFTNEWEVEISKTAFASAFGNEAYPKHDDFVYIPLMKRMYFVNSAYDEKKEGLMWRSTTWSLQLNKYEDKTDISQGDFTDLIDSFIVNNYKDTFGDNEIIEQERQTGVFETESPGFEPTNLYPIYMQDNVRKSISQQDINNIADTQVNHWSTIVARNAYNFQNENSLVTYQNQYCGDCGVASFIVKPTNSDINSDLLSIGSIKIHLESNSDNATISFSDISTQLDLNQAYLVVCKWNLKNYSTEMEVYKYTHDENLPIYRIRQDMNYFDTDNGVLLASVYNNSYINDKSVDIVLKPYGALVTNVKVYDKYMDHKAGLAELLKYTSKNDHCVVCDLARKIDTVHGYSVQ